MRRVPDFPTETLPVFLHHRGQSGTVLRWQIQRKTVPIESAAIADLGRRNILQGQRTKQAPDVRTQRGRAFFDTPIQPKPFHCQRQYYRSRYRRPRGWRHAAAQHPAIVDLKYQPGTGISGAPPGKTDLHPTRLERFAGQQPHTAAIRPRRCDIPNRGTASADPPIAGAIAGQCHASAAVGVAGSQQCRAKTIQCPLILGLGNGRYDNQAAVEQQPVGRAQIKKPRPDIS